MITVAEVKAFLGIPVADTSDEQWLASATAATNQWVGRLPVVIDLGLAEGEPWPADVQAGATMLAAHLYHGRNASQGRAGYDMAGGFQTAYADPEIARLLQLRRWARPYVAGPPARTTPGTVRWWA